MTENLDVPINDFGRKLAPRWQPRSVLAGNTGVVGKEWMQLL